MPVNRLEDVYVAELADLWSANDQMQRVIGDLANKATGAKLKRLLQVSEAHIGEHTNTLKALVDAHKGSTDVQCRAMQGLVEEARKHAIESEVTDTLRDIVIIAQYQRMSHYGVAGFGTAAAYADVLGYRDDADKLRAIVSDIYKADQYSSQLASIAAEWATTD
jgi:ferritin-like metal-binding protein YciE